MWVRVYNCVTHYHTHLLSHRYLEDVYPHIGFLTNLYPGTYALIGAASFLGVWSE